MLILSVLLGMGSGPKSLLQPTSSTILLGVGAMLGVSDGTEVWSGVPEPDDAREAGPLCEAALTALRQEMLGVREDLAFWKNRAHEAGAELRRVHDLFRTALHDKTALLEQLPSARTEQSIATLSTPVAATEERAVPGHTTSSRRLLAGDKPCSMFELHSLVFGTEGSATRLLTSNEQCALCVAPCLAAADMVRCGFECVPEARSDFCSASRRLARLCTLSCVQTADGVCFSSSVEPVRTSTVRWLL
jgi:hypothetical protein